VTEPYRFRAGAAPLLVSMPHTGTHVPESIALRLTAAARLLPDTDWHMERLYDFAEGLGASVLVATHSRYVVDLNRPPDNANLYPGRDTSSLVPTDTFFKEPLYLPGELPGHAEIFERVDSWWKPYHARLAEALEDIKARHGYALLWDAHSIFSVVPRFFEGRLPDFNLGTADGASCLPGLGEKLLAVAGRAKPYTAVLNGRFKGGYITRTYGRPAERICAIQLELSEATYMNERAPFEFREDLAIRVRPAIRAMLETYLRGAR
jgi:N-formylglutamate deformylase